jgi:hypothetical protein
MKYILLIYCSEADAAKRGDQVNQQVFQEYMTYSQDIVKSGHMVGGDPLEPASTATTVRVKDGKIVKTDGPFAETREQLGGYYIVEAKDLDEAVGLAARIPDARYGSIEVRPVMNVNM